LIAAVTLSALRQQWWSLFISCLALILALAPTFFEWRTKIDIPEEFEFAILFFVFAAIILGELQGYYEQFWWWDSLLHLSAGIALGIIGFSMFYVMYIRDKIRASPFIIALFSFTFSLGIAVLWEIFEFSMDSLFSLNLQKSGLPDTMGDLIVDAAGALLAAFLGFLYLKGKKPRVFNYLISRFKLKNPQLFKRKINKNKRKINKKN